MSKIKKLENSETLEFLPVYSAKRNLYFCTIAKNCSTSIINQLPKDFQATKPLPDTDVIVILRDPVDRWISGTVEYFTYGPHSFVTTHGAPNPSKMLMALNSYVKRDRLYAFDYHTELQSAELKTIKKFTGKIHYYYYHAGVLDDIQKDFDVFKSVSKENSTVADKHRPKFRSVLESWLEINREVLYPKLKEFYKKDYKAINKLNFVNWDIATSSE